MFDIVVKDGKKLLKMDENVFGIVSEGDKVSTAFKSYFIVSVL